MATRRERMITDVTEIEKILAKSKVIHLGLIDAGLPYVIAMNYGYTMEDGKLTLYMHSAVDCHKIDVIKENPACSFEIDCDVEPFEGELPCQYGTAYSSVMGRGKVVILSALEERQRAMEIFMKAQSGRDFTFSEKLLSVVSLLRIDVSEYTAKRRPLPLEDVEH